MEWIPISALTGGLLGPEKSLLSGARQSRRPPHIVTLLMLPLIIVIAFSLIGGLVLKAAVPESLAGSSLVMAFVYQNLDYIVPFGLMILALAAWVLLREKRPLSSLGFSRQGAARKYLIGLAGGLALYLFCMALLVACGAVRLEQALDFGPLPALLVLFGLASFVVQGGAEEILFRGWQMPAIAAKYGVAAGVGLSALTFMALHLIADVDSLYVFPFFFAFAVLLSLYALCDRSLWGVCGFHAAWNWMDTNLFGMAGAVTPFRTSFFTYSIAGDLYYLVNIAVVLAGILAILALAAFRGMKQGQPAPLARQDAPK